MSNPTPRDISQDFMNLSQKVRYNSDLLLKDALELHTMKDILIQQLQTENVEMKKKLEELKNKDVFRYEERKS